MSKQQSDFYKIVKASVVKATTRSSSKFGQTHGLWRRTPPKPFINTHNRTGRQNFRQQLSKWVKNPDYEIIDLTRATSAKWDWS